MSDLWTCQWTRNTFGAEPAETACDWVKKEQAQIGGCVPGIRFGRIYSGEDDADGKSIYIENVFHISSCDDYSKLPLNFCPGCGRPFEIVEVADDPS